jgi:hypothetical protein
MRKIIMTTILFLATLSGLTAENRSVDLLRDSGIVENYLIREGCIGAMSAPLRLLTENREYYTFRGGEQHVLFKVVLKSKWAYILFINESASGYSEWGRGHYFIKRDRTTGRFESISIPFRDDAGCYLEITTRDGLTLMNIQLFSKKIYHEVHLPATLESLLTASFSSILDMSKGVIDWPRLLYRGDRPEDRRMADYLSIINRELPRVRERDDGALNRRGEFVFIADGRPQTSRTGFNCSGFMKWLIDGWYAPLTGELTDIDQLKQRHLDKRGTRWTERVEDSQDPYFGLDWTRNLAAALNAAQTGIRTGDIEDADVRMTPFLDYREDAGYRVPDLMLLLYFLAIEEPGTAYLGSVNQIYIKKPLRKEYFHVATFFPYFDKQGRFRVTVMDQHKKPDLNNFMRQYADCDIHLVRARLDGEFSLFHIE